MPKYEVVCQWRDRIIEANSPEQAHCECHLAQLAEAQATIAALQWTPITPDNLPKPLVHEVLDPVRGFVGTVFASWPYERSIEAGWLYFRPISPPAQATIETLNVQKGEQAMNVHLAKIREINKILDDVEELEREIEALKAQVERLSAPVSDKDAMQLVNWAGLYGLAKVLNNWIAARAAEKGPSYERTPSKNS